jgi:hypothetical protein
MELIAALLLAGPLGYFARSVSQGRKRYLIVWLLVFPIQTAAVYFDTDPSGNDWQYWVINAVILAGGLGLNRLGYGLGHRRRTRRLAASPSGA